MSFNKNMEAPSSSTATITSSMKRNIKLRSSDGETFEVDEAVAMQSETIKSMMEIIPVSEVTGKTLSMVIEYCKKRLDNDHKIITQQNNKDDYLKDWAFNLFQADQPAFFDLILASHYLQIKNLEELTSQTVSDIIKGKSVEEIKETFNINSPVGLGPPESSLFTQIE